LYRENDLFLLKTEPCHMKILVPQRDELSPELAPYFDALEKSFGFVPKIGLVLGYSPNAFEAYLNLVQSHARGTSFTEIEREVILLAVSEFHGSPYCLSAHTTYAISYGLSETETVEARATTIADPKLQFLAHFGRAIAENRGKVSRQMLDDFEEWGFDARALIEAVALVMEATFSNYVALLSKIPLDFPKVQPVTT
jgi:AhpD family alkylhydroperoxidase